MKTLLGLILNLSEHNGFKCVITINMSLAEATGIQGIRPTEKLPKTKVLEVEGLSTKQHFEPIILHLLRKHSGLTKIKVDLFPTNSVSPN